MTGGMVSEMNRRNPMGGWKGGRRGRGTGMARAWRGRGMTLTNFELGQGLLNLARRHAVFVDLVQRNVKGKV